MTLVDSSGWIEYFLDNPYGTHFQKYILAVNSLIIPTLVLYEVYRQLIKRVDLREALLAVTQMEKGTIIPLNQEISLHAAEISLNHKLSTADAIIYATAQICSAEVVTLDNDFRNLPGCKVLGSA